MRVVVTGSSYGIGKGVAQEFLRHGHEVIGMDIAEATIDDKSYTHKIVDVYKDQLPEIDGVEILVNNAGVQNTGHDIDTNLKGTMRVTEKYAIQPDICSVVFMASASARTGAEFPEYCASKGGMVAYMKNVASRISQWGATSNALSPGGVLTELNQHILEDDSLMEEVLAETLLWKWASVEEIAQWTYFVAVINKSMTAQDILIDNGEEAKFNFVW